MPIFYAELKSAQIASKTAFVQWPERGLILPIGAQIVHGPRAQPCLNPGLGAAVPLPPPTSGTLVRVLMNFKPFFFRHAKIVG